MLNTDTCRIIFYLLPISDKRSFLRTCIAMNTFFAQMPEIEVAFQTVANKALFYGEHNSNYYCPLYKYTIELLCDNRDLPDSYVIADNNVLRSYAKIYKVLVARGKIALVMKLLDLFPGNIKFVVCGAMNAGNIELLEKLRDMECPIDYYIGYRAARYAAKAGKLEIIRWLIKNNYYIDSALSYAAASGGHTDVVKFFVDNDMYNTYEMCCAAARKGHIDIVKYILSGEVSPDVLDAVAYNAIENDHLEILEYVIEHGCEISDYHMSSCGHLRIWKWLIERGYFKHDFQILAKVASTGNLECLQYIHSQGFDVIDESVMTGAVNGGNVEMVKWLYKLGASGINKTLDYSILFDDENPKSLVVAQMLSWGFNFEKHSCEDAAYCGNLRALQYQHANGYVLDRQTIKFAAMGGHLDVIVWCRKQGCPWDARTCKAAAKGNRLDTLKWLRGIDRDKWMLGSDETEICPWNERLCVKAIEHEHIDILMFAMEYGCEFGSACRKAIDRKEDGEDFIDKCCRATSKLNSDFAKYIRKTLNDSLMTKQFRSY